MSAERTSGRSSEAKYGAGRRPPLLQTPDYAAALLGGDKEAVAARLGRQKVLVRGDPPPPRLSVLLYEGILHNEVGGKDVMREQLAHLLAMSEKPNISVLIVPGPISPAVSRGADHGGTMDDVSATTWRKSSRSSGGGGDCVEVTTVRLGEPAERT